MKHNYKFSYILSLSILGLYINELYAAPVTDDEQVAKPQEENIKEPEKKSKDKPGKKEDFVPQSVPIGKGEKITEH